MPTKIVINGSYGSFKLHKKAMRRYYELSGKSFDEYKTSRHCPYLVQVVEELHRRESTYLRIVEIKGNK